jgi:hypothetical protein
LDRYGAAVDAFCYMQAQISSAMRKLLLHKVDYFTECMQAEAKAMAERKGKGMNLSLKQLNAVLRL